MALALHSTFDWSSLNGAHGPANDVPARVLVARRLQDVDALSQALGELTGFALDGGYLTEVAGALVGLYLDEALAALADERPGWPYLFNVLLVLGVGRCEAGFAPSSFFSPIESEAKRVLDHSVRERRRAQAKSEVLARRQSMVAAAMSALPKDAVYLLSALHAAEALQDDDQEALVQIYQRAENDAQRASLLLPIAAAFSRRANPDLLQLLFTSAAPRSNYLMAAIWSASQLYPEVLTDVDLPLPMLIAAADLLHYDCVWYEGLLAGVVCQAVARSSSLSREAQLEFFTSCLERVPPETSALAGSRASAGGAAAWQLFELVFSSHHLRRRPIDASDLTADQAKVLQALHANSSNWLEWGSHFPSQFGMPAFQMVEQLLWPEPLWQQRLTRAWPGELAQSSLLVWFLRPLLFDSGSEERLHAFSLLSNQLLSDLHGEDLIAALRCASRLPSYPCRELSLAVQRALLAERGNAEWQSPPAVHALRQTLGEISSGALTEVLCELFQQRTGATPA